MCRRCSWSAQCFFGCIASLSVNGCRNPRCETKGSIHGHDISRTHPGRRNGTHFRLCRALFNERGHAASQERDRKSTRLNSSHSQISYAVFCLKKKKKKNNKQMHTARTI